MVDGCFMVDGPCVNHAEKAVNHVLWLTGFLGRWLTEPCLMSNFELSGHQFGTILKSFILTFQSASIQPSPVEYCLSRMQETLFQAAKTPGACFFQKKKNPAGLHHTEDRAGDAPKPIQNGNAQTYFHFISNLFQIDLGLAWVHFPKIIRRFG